MDEIDFSIIHKLTKDARMSFRRIARDLGISPDTVINRYKRLQEKGVIRGTTVIINSEKLGYQSMAVFMIDTSPTHILLTEGMIDSALILKRLIQMQNIIVATKTVGDHDLLAIGVTVDFEHMINLVDDIAKIPGVKDIAVSFWLNRTELCSKYFIV